MSAQGDEQSDRGLDIDTARAAARLVRHFVLLALAAMVTVPLPVPWQIASLGFAVTAVVVGVRALRVAWRPGLRAQLAPLLIIGLSFTVLLAVLMSATVALWPVQLERQACLNRALTVGARTACERAYEEAVVERVDELTGRRPP